MRPFPIDISGGVNLLDDPRRVRPNEVVRAQNIVPMDLGVYVTRPARGFLTALNSATDGYPVSAKFAPWAGAPVGVVTVRRSTLETKLYVVNPLDAPTTGILATVTFPAPSLRPWMAPFASKLYVLPFVALAPPAYTVSRNSIGNPVIEEFNFSGTGNESIRPKLATAYRNRFVWAHFGPGYENTLVFSDNFVPGTVGNDVLAVNGRHVNLVAAGDGEEIVAIHQVALNQINAPSQMALLVLRNYSAFLIVGEPNQTSAGAIDTLVINRVNVEVGCLSPWSVVNTPYGLVWPDRNDVWILETGTAPRPIGTKIGKALSHVPANLDYRVTAAYHRGFYRLMLYGEGQGPTDFSGLQDQWWADLRNGAPRNPEAARWWGPQQFVSEMEQAGSAGDNVTLDYGSRLFLPETRPGVPKLLYGVEIGRSGPAGQFTPSFVQYDVPNVRDNSVLIPTEQPESEVVGTEIQIDLITREFDFNEYDGISASREKIHDGLEMAVWNSNPGRLIVDAIINGGESTSTTNLDIYNAGFEAGVDQLDAGTSSAARVPQAVAAHPFPRPVGITYQFRIRNQPGYLVTDENDTLTFRRVDTQVEYRVAIAQGLYLFIDGSASFANALKSALDTATGLSWVVVYDHTLGLFTIQLPAGPASVEIPLIGDQIFPNFATDAEMLENRRILAMLGMATETDITATLGITSEVAIYQKNNSIWEFSSLDALMEVLPRRP